MLLMQQSNARAPKVSPCRQLGLGFLTLIGHGEWHSPNRAFGKDRQEYLTHCHSRGAGVDIASTMRGASTFKVHWRQRIACVLQEETARVATMSLLADSWAESGLILSQDFGHFYSNPSFLWTRFPNSFPPPLPSIISSTSSGHPCPLPPP